MSKVSPLKIKVLAELRLVKRAIETQAKVQAELAAAQALKQRQSTSDKNLFAKAVGAVQPLANPHKVLLKTVPAEPNPRPKPKDEPTVLREALSDEFDAAALLANDPEPSYTRPGVGPNVVRKLRLGDWPIQAGIDLHGLRTAEAREALDQFLYDARQQGLRCVRVIHGKGLRSPGQAPVLRAKVCNWLVQKSEVLAFVQAQPAQGGGGALVVLLQSS